MKKVLIVYPFTLCEENLGGPSKTIYNLVRKSADYGLEYSIIGGDINPVVQPFFKNIIEVDLVIESKIEKIINLLTGKPTSIMSDNEAKRIADVVNKHINDYDQVHFFTYPNVPCLKYIDPALYSKLRFSLIDCGSMFFKRRAKITANSFKNFLFSLESRNYLNIEKFLKKRSIKVHFVSEVDTNSYGDDKNAKTIEIGVNVEDFFPIKLPKKEDQKIKLLFYGNLGYAPNADGLTFIENELVPYLESKNVNFEMLIGGKSNRQSSNPNLKFLGFVDDLNLLINESDIIIFPIFWGAGIKNKVLEAFASGARILTTPTGIEGMNFISEDDPSILITNSKDPQVWLNKINELLNAPAPQQRVMPLTWKRFTHMISQFY